MIKLNQLVLFDDSGNVLGVFPTASIQIDGNNVTYDNGSLKGVNVNFGLLENGSVKEGDVLPSNQVLSLVQATKITQLNQACQSTICGGFDCDPDGSGTIYHFPYQNTEKNPDQGRYKGYVNCVLLGIAPTYGWKVQDSDGNWITLNITPDNFKTYVSPKAMNFEMAQTNQYRTLEDQVNNAIDIPTIKNIAWGPATY